jgi:V8-like Glu-specific endopeptidase
MQQPQALATSLKVKRGSLFIIIMLALVLGACGGPATPSSSLTGENTSGLPQSSPEVVQQNVTDDLKTVQSYWTPEKMKQAINGDTIKIPADVDQTIKNVANDVIKNQNSVAEQAGLSPAGKLPDIPSMKPEDLQNLLKQLQQLTGTQGSTGTHATASLLSALSPLNSNYGATYQFPLSTVGKVFFQNPVTGENRVCSATAINSPNKSLVNTAGHCVYKKDGWAKNWIFCPMYYEGEAPDGCWAASYYYVNNAWKNSAGTNREDFSNDYALVVVHPSSEFGRVVSSVGGVGYRYGADAEQAFYAYGYPAADPFDGETMRDCNGTGRASTYGSREDAWVIRITCDMTGGSSGGPWFSRANGNWYLNGHNSFGRDSDPNAMYSPYYGKSWYRLYQSAANTDPGEPVSI